VRVGGAVPEWAGDGGEWNTVLVLGVGRLGARIIGARWGKTLWVKWPWLRAPFIASGRQGEGLEEATDRRRWKFNTSHFQRAKEGEESTRC
jgi:hypothetical protein